VDPSNRLVADSLEADWNDGLRVLAEAKERYEQQTLAAQTMAQQIDRERIIYWSTICRLADHPGALGQARHRPKRPPRVRNRIGRLTRPPPARGLNFWPEPSRWTFSPAPGARGG
jgi:hypothetical protein